MKFVAVTACITGIAHTYMAQAALEQAAKKLGHEMVVETQGSAGTNPMKQELIDAADGVIFAVDLQVKGRERFAGKPFIELGVAKVIGNRIRRRTVGTLHESHDDQIAGIHPVSYTHLTLPTTSRV